MDKIVYNGVVYKIYSMEVVEKQLRIYCMNEKLDKKYNEDEEYSHDGGYYKPYTGTKTTTRMVLKIDLDKLPESTQSVENISGED